MQRVMAQGTFDILHPGHVHYLEASAELGDELVVVIARDGRVRTRKDLFMDEESRRRVVEALGCVDRAVLGSEGDLFDTVAELGPDVITLGYDQSFEPEALEADLAEAGFPDVEVVRIGPGPEDVVSSSSDVKARLEAALGEAAFHTVAGEDG
ncbi:MAG: adenylyltransferase/cytidyltransferase family protein [Halobacteriales archaeon]|nr:adenylyltransferase/cytidyltransferase family protein [Halobacteriales archaeon]